MSVLPAEVHGALNQLLQGLQSTDNTLRSQAEEQLNTEWVHKRSDVTLMGLIEQMSGSQDVGVSTYPNALSWPHSDETWGSRLEHLPL